MSDAAWIGLFTFLGLCVKEYFDRARANDAKDVRRMQGENITTQGEQIAEVKTNVKLIEKATNSMKDQLVQKTEAEGVARGAIEERARADEREKPK